MKRKRSFEEISLLRPNFSHLAAKYPSFATHLRRNAGRVELKDPQVLRELTIATLAHEFHLQVCLPLDRLCPPVPSRVQYLDFVHSLSPPCSAEETITVIDIGVGCSCIYPLLGHRKYGWRFIGTDIDSLSAEFAVENVVANHLEDVVRVYRVSDSSLLQSHLLLLSSNAHSEHFTALDPDRLVEDMLTYPDILRCLRGPVRYLAHDFPTASDAICRRSDMHYPQRVMKRK